MKSKTTVVAIIPARYGSTRFPGKSLSLIKGKPMIQWVYERTRLSRLVDRIVVATDDERIEKAVMAFGGNVVMTSKDHPTGTDRIAEAARDITSDIVVNVQGDEPLIHPDMIDAAVAPLISDPGIQIGTLCRKIEDPNEAFDPNVVKVVFDESGYALYFSRAPIPWDREAWAGKRSLSALGLTGTMYKHIGLYVYRRRFLVEYARMPQTALERIEKLEQLRALEKGFKIKVVETVHESFGVDIPDDLGKIEKFIEAGRARI